MDDPIEQPLRPSASSNLRCPAVPSSVRSGHSSAPGVARGPNVVDRNWPNLAPYLVKVGPNPGQMRSDADRNRPSCSRIRPTICQDRSDLVEPRVMWPSSAKILRTRQNWLHSSNTFGRIRPKIGQTSMAVEMCGICSNSIKYGRTRPRYGRNQHNWVKNRTTFGRTRPNKW